MKGFATRGAILAFGEVGLKALAPAWITSRQIEAGRRVLVRYLRRGGQMWIRIYPDKPITKKPAETRQGGGKAAVDHWAAVVKPGRILYEIAGIQEAMARDALRHAAHKLPIATKIVSRADYLMDVGVSAERSE